jgi:hypothetical protein
VWDFGGEILAGRGNACLLACEWGHTRVDRGYACSLESSVTREHCVSRYFLCLLDPRANPSSRGLDIYAVRP